MNNLSTLKRDFDAYCGRHIEGKETSLGAAVYQRFYKLLQPVYQDEEEDVPLMVNSPFTTKLLQAASQNPNLESVCVDHVIVKGSEAFDLLMTSESVRSVTSKWASFSEFKDFLTSLSNSNKAKTIQDLLVITQLHDIDQFPQWENVLTSVHTRIETLSIRIASCRHRRDDALQETATTAASSDEYSSPLCKGLEKTTSLKTLALNRLSSDQLMKEICVSIKTNANHAIKALHIPCHSIQQAEAIAQLLAENDETCPIRELDLSRGSTSTFPFPRLTRASKNFERSSATMKGIARGIRNNSSLVTLNLSSTHLANVLASPSSLAFHQALRQHPNLQTLNLSHCSLTNQDLEALGCSWPVHLQHLDLSLNRELNCTSLLTALKDTVNTRLKVLNLHDSCYVQDASDVVALAKLVQNANGSYLASLKDLDLGRVFMSDNRIAEKATVLLTQAIIRNKSLAKIALSSFAQNTSQGANHVHDLLMGLANSNSTLQNLSLSDCVFSSDACGEAVEQLVRSRTLYSLELTSIDGLEADGLKHIANGLSAKDCKLHTLRLRGLSVTAADTSMAPVYEALTLESSSLQVLDLSGQYREKEVLQSLTGWTTLCDSLVRMNKLASLILPESMTTFLTDQHVRMFVQGMEGNVSLRHVQGFVYRTLAQQDRVAFLLKLNASGRHMLRKSSTSADVWMHVIARSSNDPSVSFYLLKESNLLLMSKSSCFGER